MSRTTLGDVVEFKYGKSLPKRSRSGAGYPVFGSNGEVGRHKDSVTDGTTIIVGRKGSFGAVTWSPDPCWPIDTTYYVDDSATDADLRWLYYLLDYLPLTEMNSAAAIPGLNRNDAYELPVEVPSIEEQQRIAAVLDAADQLKIKRRKAVGELDTLTQAIFIDMFVRNSHEFEFAPIGDLVAAGQNTIRTGPFGSQLLHEEFTDEGIAVLGIDNAVQNRFAWGERRYITPEKYEELKRYTVRPGDVLVTIMGTTGRVAVVPDDIPTAINTKHLCCITLDRDRCLPDFLWAALRFHPAVLRDLGATHGAVMPGLNMGKVKGASVPIPPLRLQQEFTERKRAIEHHEEQLLTSKEAVGELFSSLQQRAFRGDL